MKELTPEEKKAYHAGWGRGFDAGLREGSILILDQVAEELARYRTIAERWGTRKPQRKAKATPRRSIWTAADDEEETAFLRTVFAGMFPEPLHPRELTEPTAAEV